MAAKNHHIIANLTGSDVFIAVRDDETAAGVTVLTFLLRRPAGRILGIVHRIVPRHFVGIPFEGPEMRYRLENPAQVTLVKGTMPNGRQCWAITGFNS